jgi:hypothetical protein
MLSIKLIGASGKPLCQWCHVELQQNSDSFCSGDCERKHAHASPAQRLQQHVFLRDQGVCHRCGMDCEELKNTILSIVAMYGNQYARSVLMTTGFKKLEATALAQDPQQDFWVVEERDGTLDSAETICRSCASRRRKRRNAKDGYEDEHDLFDEGNA